MSDDLTPPHWGADEPARYDMSIHSNPSAAAWAAFFKQTFPDSDEDLMHGWFANAMMAMHDHMQPAATPHPAMELPEVRALVAAATQFAQAAMTGSDLGWPLVNLDSALSAFTEASA